jgi:drug/metabolite transporter (DMT)-like permease
VGWWTSVTLALVATVASFLMFLRGLSILGPVRTAIVSTVEPFFTALMGAAFLAQPLTPTVLTGGALIAAAVVLLQLRLAQTGTIP